MKKKTPAQIRLLCGCFAALILTFAALLAAALGRGEKVRFGVSATPDCYGAAMLLQTPSAQYTVSVGSGDAVLKEALESGALDAAVLRYETFETMDAEKYEVRAVLSYCNLTVLSRDKGIKKITDLNDKKLVLAEDLRGSAEEAMLKKLLGKADVICSIGFGDNLGENDVLLVRPGDEYRAVSADRTLARCFVLSSVWKGLMDSARPAGACLVVSKAYLGKAGSSYNGFMRTLKDGCLYGDEKRKKTVEMCVAGGLARSTEEADYLISTCSFSFLEGDDLAASLQARKEL
ncbi:MAG: hypothetical protein MJ136_00805 [Clostridia bacterium]|nr:hypothetical protein [Clostridia bacterium]